MKYTVIRDTREQNGWFFSESSNCNGTISGTLKTGDYTLKDYENILCVERKATINEFSQNITQKRFEKELERMQEFEYSFILLEFDMFDLYTFPKSANLPSRIKAQIKITPQFILKKLIEYELKYKTKIIFCGQYGKEISSSIFKRVIECR